MKVRNATSGEILTLEKLPFAKGGEGLLYKVVAPNDYLSLVAKIYHPDKRTAQRHHKLRYLIQHPPVFKEQEQTSLISWPVALLEKEQQFIGFLMPYAKGELLEVLATAQLPKSLSRKWQRFKLGTAGALKLRQKVCFNIAVALYHIHQTGHYVMVDLKPDNILIQENGLISLVDIDSVEIVNGNQMLFPAAMATPEFAPPEFHALNRTAQGISLSWDQFSMAIIFYKILLGIHPFAATSKGKYDMAVSLGEKLRHGLYVHNKKCHPYLGVIPKLHSSFSKLPYVAQTLFNLCFVEGVLQPKLRPSAEDWCLALDEERQKEKIITYSIPITFLELNIPQLKFSENSIFEKPFKTTFSIAVKEELPRIIKTISKEQNSWRLKLKKWLVGVSVMITIGLYWFVGNVALWGILGIIFFVIDHYQQKKKREILYKNQTRLLFLDSEIDKRSELIFNQKVETLFNIYQEQKKSYQQMTSMYYQEVDQLQDKWEAHFFQIKKKCTLLNREKREKVNEIIQERNEQLLWKQFLGKTVEQKQNFLKKKHLPNKLQQLTVNYQKQVEEVDNKHQLAWRTLEEAFYHRLEEIDRTIVHQRVKAKTIAEQEFIATRQDIINAIQKQKKEAEDNYENQKALTEKSVKNYSEQLEEIEATAINKKILLEQGLELKFQRLLDAIETEHKKAEEALKVLENRFLEDYELLFKPILKQLEELGLSNLEFIR